MATTEQAPAACSVRVLPAAKGRVPANAPALLVVDESGGGATATIKPSLSSAGHDTIVLPGMTTDVTGEKILRLDGPLVAGRDYDLHAAIECTVPPARALGQTFVASETTPLPAVVGTLRETNADSYGNDITLSASPELAAYLPVAIVTMYMNGVVASRLVGPTDPSTLVFKKDLLSTCMSADGSFYAGTATMSLAVSAHIAGAEIDPAPAKLDIPVDCDAVAARHARVDRAPAATDDGGCAVSSARARSSFGGGAGVGLGLGLACIAVLRRRSGSGGVA